MVPRLHHNQVSQLAHDILWAGHLEVEKTQERVLARFFCLGAYQDIKDICAKVSCPEYQLVTPCPQHWVPLVPLLLMGTPFELVGIGIVRPVASRTQCQWITLLSTQQW